MNQMAIPETQKKAGFRDCVRADCNRFRQLSGKTSRAWMFTAFHPRVFPVVLIRISTRFHSMGLSPIAAAISLFNQLVFRLEVPGRAMIEPGLVLPHPGGQVFGAARIGSNVTIFQNVTLGARMFENSYDLTTRPVIENGVTIGANAVVLGPVTIGAEATIAANSLVVADVPPRTTVIGVPAKVRGGKETS